MRQIGLYYPYFHVRDDNWLKAAALYLPQVARVCPPRYPTADSPTAEALRGELDFLIDIDPGPQATEVAQEFEALMEGPSRTHWQSQYCIIPVTFKNHVREDDIAWIHSAQFGEPQKPPQSELYIRLEKLGMVKRTRPHPLTGEFWIGMHPRLVAAYSCALAERIALSNALVPVTDQPQLFTLPHGGTVEDMTTALLNFVPPSGGRQIEEMYACAAVRAVLPADLEHVPVEKIVRARQRLSDEFEEFRAHIDGLSEQFSQLKDVQDHKILYSRLEAMVERDLTRPSRDLERGLRSLGLNPVRSVFGLKSLELPAIAALAASAAEFSPIVAGGGAIAIQVLSSARTARREAIAQRTSAAGYLLGLRRELDPVGALERMRRTLRGPHRR
jgi:hypothetical protein